VFLQHLRRTAVRLYGINCGNKNNYNHAINQTKNKLL
jgi:hypothetical protein